MDIAEFDIEFLAQKLSENPQSPLFARLADLYVAQEQTVEALKLCEEGIQAHPQYYAGYIALGKTHLALKEYSKARTAFECAQELSPFNQALAKLIATVPEKPDESARTTDENYFAQQSEQQPEQQPAEQIQPEQAAAAAEEPVQPAAEPQFETPTAEEMGFTQSAEDIDTAILPEQQSRIASSNEVFPTFDEYFVRNQSSIATDPASTLDEYLAGSTGQEKPQSDFIAEEPVVPNSAESAASQESTEPEVVYSSPEQAQLFAEMMGGQTAGGASPDSSSNIDELAEKLRSVERIVPEENYRPQSPAGEENQSSESEMVTPTLAEIYASQGEYNAAIQAYEILMFSQPAKVPEFQKRIEELQQKQMEKDGLI